MYFQALEFRVYIYHNERVEKMSGDNNDTIITNIQIIIVVFIQYKINILCDPGPQNQS